MKIATLETHLQNTAKNFELVISSGPLSSSNKLLFLRLREVYNPYAQLIRNCCLHPFHEESIAFALSHHLV